MGSDIGQAIALCQCHGQIGAEVIRPSNLELKTIFANIDALHNTLLNFKTEVGRSQPPDPGWSQRRDLF